ncbi:related to peptidyl-tRNA hydrolase domain protein [Ramularia collo-cygni]|uniref:Related to peptidyl-tRNA hydrolase domain protein n=1 Tax=Ramularia collo-cygni TaxID=112498 RepID=A0A2D3V0D0_9PEZI|nr:related to peptidyl-tRNA hydrolase domain protein [Ramularia collo-cygni]CZT20175.1 related to peptidyl-tRNA hydrolase domain protein [Ramularia collo-cygni]
MLQAAALKRVTARLSTTTSWSAPASRSFAANRSSDADEDELKAARQWLSNLDLNTIPRELCDVSFSRSSGPGGQNVNKVSSKTTLRLPISALLQRVPKVMHPPLMSSRYYAAKSSDIVIQADASRKQNDNVNACFRKLHDLIVQAGRETVPGETTPEQRKRVEQLQKAEAAGRRKMKEFQSKKKGARRDGGRGDE